MMMTGKKQFTIYFAVLAIVVQAAAAAKSCSQRNGCKKCLAKEDDGCAWYVGPGSEGSCIDAEDCQESNGGECFLGSGDYACGISCSTQTGSTCEDCLGYDAFGKKNKGKKSDCAWFLRDGQEPRCIYHKQCTDRGFERGECFRGTNKKKKNIKQCQSLEPPQDECELNTSCKSCFGPDPWKGFGTCAWYTHGSIARCINEYRCDDRGFERGNCYKGSEIFGPGKENNPNKVCKRIKKGKQPVAPQESDDEIDDEIEEDDDTTPVEECSEFDGMCTDCLKGGCYWVNDIKECVDSCEQAPADTGCRGTTPPSSNRRELLSFETEADMLCWNFDRQDENYNLCKAASTGGCNECVNTYLITDTGIQAPTCMWMQETGECISECTWYGGCGMNTCEAPKPPPPPPPVVKPNISWPEMLGKTVPEGKAYIQNDYGTEPLNFVVLPEGSATTEDFRKDRVRLFVDKETETIIVSTPRIG